MKDSVLKMEHMPSFTRNQIVNVSDIQRNWRKVVEPKLNEFPFVLMFSGTDPKASFLSYEKFEELWSLAEEAAELKLKLELLTRHLARQKDENLPISFSEVVSKAGITASEIEEEPDVELE